MKTINPLYILKKLIPKPIFNAVQPAYHFLFSFVSALVYGKPSEKLIVVGVTGTTGKTSSVYLMAKVLEGAGLKTGYTSTAMFNDGKKEWLNDKKMTMLGRFFTQRMLARMVANKCKVAIVETSSEGIKQFRHKFINYDILLVTGLYPEHIESHGSFEEYKKAKGKLFAHLKTCKPKYMDENYDIVRTDSGIKKTELEKVKKTILADLEDEHVEYFMSFWAEQKSGYTGDVENIKLSKEIKKDIKVFEYRDVEIDKNGTKYIVEEESISLSLLGIMSVKNSLNAFLLAKTLNLDIEKIKKSLADIEGIAGRLEKIDEGQNFTVIVDYAFEPRAVGKLYETVKLIPHNKIIHVLGSAGGGRDVSRRPILGKLAGENADIIIVTDEDPYDDNPEIIIDQVFVGAEKAGKLENDSLFKILDRRDAIKKAIKLAQENDILLVTGKGSEQAIVRKNGEKEPWDDRAVIRGMLSENKERTAVDKNGISFLEN
ncbi:MAG: UDP-N-acetylmuramyl-tripeptide synthetase [Patescibacteria group bacterium]|jgi:UDP-N-acetylmuramoyl-L-alanyl-D-glutamate--2,6-diaminopimelate ligase|nr:UDP-N-acetylmuramyl-tripeptide synthetase [Patescibacteria group bacterium]